MLETSVVIFWMVIAGMTVVASLVVVLPWLRPVKIYSTIDRKGLNLSIYQERLLEIDLYHLSKEQQEEEKATLARALLADTEEKDTKTGENAKDRITPWLLAALLSFSALLLYVFLGGDWTNQSAKPVLSEVSSVEQMVKKLAERLVLHPRDQLGWKLLGRSYSALERYSESANAYEKAYALESKDPDLGADYAEALVLANGNHGTVQARTIINQVLEMAPTHPKTLWLSGMDAFQEGKYPLAVDAWKRLLIQLPKESELFEKIQTSIEEAEKQTVQSPLTPSTPNIP
ncbi:hypothetical protein CCP3SC1AL1_1290010 [Gammaproteobacteria bacterium]